MGGFNVLTLIFLPALRSDPCTVTDVVTRRRIGRTHGSHYSGVETVYSETKISWFKLGRLEGCLSELSVVCWNS